MDALGSPPFTPDPPSLLPGKREIKDLVKAPHYPGQPILVDLPVVGEVLLPVKARRKRKKKRRGGEGTLRALYAWRATDAHRKDHQVNTRWTAPSF